MAVRYEPEGRIAVITLDRPEALNTFDRAMHVELHDAWIAFRDDPELVVAIVTGAGDRAFSAGADVRSWGAPRRVAAPASARPRPPPVGDALRLGPAGRAGDVEADDRGRQRLLHRRRADAGAGMRPPHRVGAGDVPVPGGADRRADDRRARSARRASSAWAPRWSCCSSATASTRRARTTWGWRTRWCRTTS